MEARAREELSMVSQFWGDWVLPFIVIKCEGGEPFRWEDNHSRGGCAESEFSERHPSECVLETTR